MKKPLLLCICLISALFVFISCGLTPPPKKDGSRTDVKNTERENTHTHVYEGKWTVIREATDKEEGRKFNVCVLCGQDVIETIPRLEAQTTPDETGGPTTVPGGETNTPDGHTHVYGEWKPVTAASCVKTGLNEAFCACGDRITETVPALGHSYGSYKQTKAPTCTASGAEERTCSRCGAKDSRSVSALGHKAVTDKAVAATCTAAGKTEGSHRSPCGTVLKAQTTVSALGHSYGSYKQTKAPTCTASGSEERTCSRCGAKDSRSVSALGHSYKNGVCTRCGASGESSGLEYYTYDSGVYVAGCGSFKGKDLVIPSSYNGYPVIGIYGLAFEN